MGFESTAKDAGTVVGKGLVQTAVQPVYAAGVVSRWAFGCATGAVNEFKK